MSREKLERLRFETHGLVLTEKEAGRHDLQAVADARFRASPGCRAMVDLPTPAFRLPRRRPAESAQPKRALRTSLSDTSGERTMTRSPTSSVVSSSAAMSLPLRTIPPTSAPVGRRRAPIVFPA